MFQSLKQLSNAPSLHKGVIAAKRLWYRERGEPVQYGPHKLRYLPGTRPVRLKYINSPDATVRNDVMQINFFLDSVKPGDFVLDIGGHFGQYAVLLGSLVSDRGRVVSFEPDPRARETLDVNLQLNSLFDRVEIESLALFDQEGEHTFFSKGADSMSSLARSGLGKNASSPDVVKYTVRTIRLDDYLATRNLGSPQWIKLDTEGAEINILNGASELLKSGVIIICELHPYAWEEFGTSFDELLRLVINAGKTIEYLDSSMRIQDGASYGSVIIR
ncbi:MAG: FkbM family methyltransferase [Pyrinomonadaceae bacterium]|nr:FkbM family methyltransferase [Pyrinomonadaceae bacterium]